MNGGSIAASPAEHDQERGLRPHPAPLGDQQKGTRGGDLLTARHEDSQTGHGAQGGRTCLSSRAAWRGAPVTRGPEPERSDVHDVPSLLDQHVDEPGRQVVVAQQPHADGRSGSRRSRTVSAA